MFVVSNASKCENSVLNDWKLNHILHYQTDKGSSGGVTELSSLHETTKIEQSINSNK